MPAPVRQGHGSGAGAAEQDEAWYRGIQRAAGGAAELAGNVADGAGEAWGTYQEWKHDAAGAAGQAAWDAGPGLVSGLFRLAPFDSGEQVADGIDSGEEWLQRTYGADTSSGAYQGVYGGGTLVASVLGAGKFKAGAEVVEGGAKALARGGDDAAGPAAKHGDETAATTRTPEQEAARDSGRPDKIPGPGEFDPQTVRGISADELSSRIPPDWTMSPSKKGDGWVFRDPDNRGRQIRIMYGYPSGSRPDPITWGPYAVVSQNGERAVKVPLEGNPAL